MANQSPTKYLNHLSQTVTVPNSAFGGDIGYSNKYGYAGNNENNNLNNSMHVASKQSSLLKESQIKMRQMESDIKLKEMKLQLVQQQNSTRISEYCDEIKHLQDQIFLIRKEKNELLLGKDEEISSLNGEINLLEQELIQAKLDVANIKSQLQEERNKAIKMKRLISDKSKVEQIIGTSKIGGKNEFLKNLQLENKAKQFNGSNNNTNSNANTSNTVTAGGGVSNQEEERKLQIDYANYLMEHQEQMNQLRKSPDRRQVSRKLYPVDYSIVEQKKEEQQNKDDNKNNSPKKEEVKKKAANLDDDEELIDDQSPMKLREQLQEILRGNLDENKIQDKETLKKWIDTFLPALQAGKEIQQQKKFKEALKKGVPSELRGIVWSEMIGNDLRITEKLYQVLLERSKICEQNVEKDQHYRKNVKVIEEDLHRTFGELGHFRYGNKLYQPLKNILIAYSILRPDLGYVQGMSYVAGSILLHTASEFEAFRCFGNLMNRDLLFHFYSFDMEKVNIIFHVFMRSVKDKLPKMHNLFKMTNLSCSVFLFEWIVALYSNIFPLEVSSRIWDQYLFYGDFLLIKVALSICTCLEQKVSSDNFEMLVLLFKNVKNFVVPDTLYKAMEEIKFSKKDYDSIKKQVESTPGLERLI